MRTGGRFRCQLEQLQLLGLRGKIAEKTEKRTREDDGHKQEHVLL